MLHYYYYYCYCYCYCYCDCDCYCYCYCYYYYYYYYYCYTLLNVDRNIDLEWHEHSLCNLRPIACVLGDSQMFVRFWKHMCRRSLTNFPASHFTTVSLKPPLWLQGKVGCRCSAQSDEQPTAVWSVTYSWPQLKMWDDLGLFQTFWADFGGKPHITSPPAVLAQPLQRFSCCLRFACAWVPLWSRSPAHREWTLKGRGGQKRNWDHAQNDFKILNRSWNSYVIKIATFIRNHSPARGSCSSELWCHTARRSLPKRRNGRWWP